MELPDRSQARSWEGKDVVDRDGQRLGRCVGVFADTATGVPEWLHVDVEGHVRSFVPALEATEADGTVQVGFSREAVLAAPSVGDDEQLSKAEEVALYRHYGVPVESNDGSVLPAADASAATPSVRRKRLPRPARHAAPRRTPRRPRCRPRWSAPPTAPARLRRPARAPTRPWRSPTPTSTSGRATDRVTPPR